MSSVPSTDLPVVLRLPRLDQSEAGYVLLHVSSAGRNHLDLKLIGTDGESVFSVSLKHNQTSSLRDRSFKGNQEELDNILVSVLLGTEKDEPTVGIEAVAKIQNDSMTIAMQRHVEGIAQRFANIKLTETQDEEVELYDWCGFTVESRNKTITKLESLTRKLQEKEEEAQKLKSELADLVKLKNAHEDSLLEKFSLLLNEKKLKIRDQQRLLETATVDPAKLDAVLRSRGDTASRSPGPSRPGKRKAKALNDESEEESEDGFEKMEVDEPQAANDSDEDQPQTPDPESTADEASDDDEPPSPPPAKTIHSLRNKNITAEPISSAGSTHTDELPPPPPIRELPFGKKKAAPPSKPVIEPEGSATESDDDDEL